MSNLKDTDFDDLFRRASDKYPLRTDNADWDKMAAALDQDPTPAGFDGTDADDRRRKRRFFWLLLFIPLGGAGYYTWLHTGHGSSHPAIAIVAAPGNRQDAGGRENTSQKAGQGSAVAAQTDPAAAAVIKPAATSANVQQSGANRQQVGSTSVQQAGTNVQQTGTNVQQAGANGVHNVDLRTTRSQSGMHRNNPGIAGNQSASPVHKTKGQRFAGALVGGEMLADGTTGETTSPQPYIAAQPLSLEWAGDMQRARIANDYHLSVAVTAPPAAKNNEPEKPKKPKTSYLYAGILGAPDISTVKMQSVKGVGVTFGVLVGYAFNPRWSIETGAYVDRKNYYTEGEYFDKEHLPGYITQLESVDGTCYMWEIPLNVRYTFNPEAKTKWFATAGLSTYLMSKESYTYAYKRGSWYGQGAWINTKPSQYPFSIVNLSGGFEQRLGRVGNLRVEPYLRLPLQGVGTGKLPIMSAGVNIGITRRLW